MGRFLPIWPPLQLSPCAHFSSQLGHPACSSTGTKGTESDIIVDGPIWWCQILRQFRFPQGKKGPVKNVYFWQTEGPRKECRQPKLSQACKGYMPKGNTLLFFSPSSAPPPNPSNNASILCPCALQTSPLRNWQCLKICWARFGAKHPIKSGSVQGRWFIAVIFNLIGSRNPSTHTY